MPTSTPTRVPPTGDFPGKAWQQVLARDPAADGSFVYAVRSTGIFCKPSCPSRRPTRRNVSFFASPAEAVAAGFRGCLRCRPESVAPDELAAALATVLPVLLKHSRRGAPLTLPELAERSGIPAARITRAFERVLGVTPAQYARTHRLNAFRDALRPRVTGDAAGETIAAPPPPSITEALYAAGFGSSSRLYEQSNETLGMTPSAMRDGGAGETIHYTLFAGPLGRTLVGATATGVCLIAFGDSDPQLRAELSARFPKAGRREIHDPAAADDSTSHWLEEAARFVQASLSEHPLARSFPLHIRATAFQQRIWQALQAIPRGETRSYAAVARELGRPSATRAVAAACAANPVALAIPCHRVVGTSGALTGYRWGVERKRILLEREGQPPAGNATSPPPADRSLG